MNNESDIIENFIDEHLEETKSATDKITLNILYQHFRRWYKANYIGQCMSQEDFRAHMQNRLPFKYEKII